MNAVERNPEYDGPDGVFAGYGEYDEPTPESLRAEADRLENAASKADKGRLFVHCGGQFFLHKGTAEDARHFNLLSGLRELSEAEVTALCVIPEFKAYLKKVRGEA